MKKLSLLLGAILAVSIATMMHIGSVTTAPDASTDACRRRFVYEMAARRDEFRAHIFGSRSNRSGGVEVLTGGGEFPRAGIGIFETKERLTSELVEPIVQSYRTYRCKLRAVCGILENSFDKTQTDLADITVLGCEPEQLPLYPECYLATTGQDDPPIFGTQENRTSLTGECQVLAEDTLQTERQILRMATAYDAGYRSMLQFAGMMDWMMEDLPSKAIRPVRDMVHMLGRLHTIPCFITQCDNPDTSQGF